MNIFVNDINFQAGLNNKILIQEKLLQTIKQERLMFNEYNIHAQFNKNKAIALANKFCLEIFSSLLKKYKISLTYPPFIYEYERKNLVNPTQATNFCISDTQEVLTNDCPFPGRSIFFKNIKSLEKINFLTELSFKNKKTSSSHFLAPFVHEWIHSFHLDYIFSKFGYSGTCDYLNSVYPSKCNTKSGYSILQELQNKILTSQENQLVYDVLGEYSTKPVNQYLEIISETFTKCICKSLNNYKLKNDPNEILNNEPKEFLRLLNKIWNFKPTA